MEQASIFWKILLNKMTLSITEEEKQSFKDVL